MKSLVVFSLFFLAICCCRENDDINCTQEARAGLNVNVRDALTNNYLGEGITVVAQDGNYTEILELINFNPPAFAGAWEREGDYIITVSGEGYVTYVSETITVTSDPCHVIPQTLDVSLQPE